MNKLDMTVSSSCSLWSLNGLTSCHSRRGGRRLSPRCRLELFSSSAWIIQPSNAYNSKSCSISSVKFVLLCLTSLSVSGLWSYEEVLLDSGLLCIRSDLGSADSDCWSSSAAECALWGKSKRSVNWWSNKRAIFICTAPGSRGVPSSTVLRYFTVRCGEGTVLYGKSYVFFDDRN